MTKGPTAAVPIDPTPKVRRSPGPRGRPKILARDQIVAVALDMLAQNGASGFTLNKLGQRLGASTMTLYTYFPSREALLNEVANRIFDSFEAPPKDIGWREGVAAWLYELRRLIDRYPMGLHLIKLNGAITPSWLKAFTSLARIMAETGLPNRTAIMALNWISRSSMSLLLARDALHDESTAVRAFMTRTPEIPEDDRALMMAFSEGVDRAAADELYDFGVRNILIGLDAVIASANPEDADS